MENNFYPDNFERLLKEKSDEFRMYPSRRVWHSIYNDLHPSRRWPSAAMSLLLLLMLIFIGYLNTSDIVINRNPVSGDTNSQASAVVAANPKQPAVDPAQQSTDPLQNLSDQPGDQSSGSFFVPGTADLSNDQATNTATPGNNAIAVKPNSKSGNASVIPATASTRPANDQFNQQVVVEMDNYIQSGKLIADVMNAKNKKDPAANAKNSIMGSDEETTTTTSNINDQQLKLNSPVAGNTVNDQKTAADQAKDVAKKPVLKSNTPLDPNAEKSWIEDYAFHNKPTRKGWKDRVNYEVYLTPSVGYRKLQNTANPEPVVTSLTASPVISQNVNNSVNQRTAAGLEAGVAFSYSFAKKFRLKAGVQLNYTSYGIKTDQTYHPVLTTLMLNNINTGYSYLEPRTTSLSNKSGVQPVTVHNRTYQVSVPVGLAVKLAGNQKMEWYVGGSVQPTYVLGGKAYLISSDYQHYVQESSMMRKWNLNTSVETYLNYKLGNYSIQVGPQFRYQVMSTYNKKYTMKENLYNTGLKLGIVKGF